MNEKKIENLLDRSPQQGVEPPATPPDFVAWVEIAKAAESPTAYSVAVESLADARRVNRKYQVKNKAYYKGLLLSLPASYFLTPYALDKRSRAISNELASEIHENLKGIIPGCDSDDAIIKIDYVDNLVIQSLSELSRLTHRQAALGECYTKKYNDRLFEFLGSQR